MGLMENSPDTKKYIGVKMIKALPMNRLDYNMYRGWELPEDENGADEGFLVEYVDGGKSNHTDHVGYISWSPKGVFNNAYHSVKGVPFGVALEAVKKGTGMRLPSWSKDVIIRVFSPIEESEMSAPYLYVESGYGKVPWKETMIELFSNEWEIVN